MLRGWASHPDPLCPLVCSARVKWLVEGGGEWCLGPTCGRYTLPGYKVPQPPSHPWPALIPTTARPLLATHTALFSGSIAPRDGSFPCGRVLERTGD